MTAAQKSVPLKLHMYTNFQGLNSSSSEIVMEKPDAQAYVSADNVFNDWRGFISNERALQRLLLLDANFLHVRYLPGDPTSPFESGYAIHALSNGELRIVRFLASSEDSDVVDTRIPSDLTPTFWGGLGTLIDPSLLGRRFTASAFSQAKNGIVLCASWVGLVNTSSGPSLLSGASVTPLSGVSGFSPQYSDINCPIVVQGRLGLARLYTSAFFGGSVIHFSRVTDHEIFNPAEAPGEPSVLRAFDLDVRNVIGGVGVITGLANFESDKLAIFTNERAYLYTVDPDLTKWALDPNARIGTGTISHNSIAEANGDLIYCSEYGVHTMRRSAMNGSVLFSSPLSQKVTEIYQALLAKLPSPIHLNATFEKRTGIYHIFFPVSETESYRLSVAINPQGNEGQETMGHWSLTSFGRQVCADTLNGNMLVGTTNGLYRYRAEGLGGMHGEGSVTLPLLWHGDMLNPKVSHSLMLIASGSGKVTISAQDETGRELSEVEFELPESGVNEVIEAPSPHQFLRPFQHRYIGLRLTIKIDSQKPLRIYGVGVNVKKDM
jgi:hypothetical protein